MSCGIKILKKMTQKAKRYGEILRSDLTKIENQRTGSSVTENGLNYFIQRLDRGSDSFSPFKPEQSRQLISSNPSHLRNLGAPSLENPLQHVDQQSASADRARKCNAGGSDPRGRDTKLESAGEW